MELMRKNVLRRLQIHSHQCLSTKTGKCWSLKYEDDIPIQNHHVNISCVEYHLESGASWYVKSKLSVLHQVYATLTKTYPKPIETPLHVLCPARENKK
jgi:hypothetical protein